MDLIREHRRDLQVLAKRYGVTDIRVFGSVSRGNATHESDIDLLVQALPGIGLLSAEEFRYQAELVLGHSVDVMTNGALDDELAQIVKDAVPI